MRITRVVREDAAWRPVACVSVRDESLRRSIIDALHEDGWAVLHQPTGLHVVETLSGLILGDRPWMRIELVVVDDQTPGCRGRTIERGLRELGIHVPVIVVDDPAQALREIRARSPRRPRSSAARWAPPPAVTSETSSAES